jgi:hypothetical protein
MSEREVLMMVIEWLREHHEDIATKLFDDVPAAAITLAGESRSAQPPEEH